MGQVTLAVRMGQARQFEVGCYTVLKVRERTATGHLTKYPLQNMKKALTQPSNITRVLN